VLGDDRITHCKSLMSATFTQDTLRANNMSVLTNAHLRSPTKTPSGRARDYSEALNTIGIQRILDIDNMIKKRLVECTHDDVSIVKKAFKHWDRNVDGTIDIREFQSLLAALSLHFTELEVFALFGM
jgi:hypothetical protein